MKNLATYIRVICILLCMTVFAGVCFFAVSKSSSGRKKRAASEAAVSKTENTAETEPAEKTKDAVQAETPEKTENTAEAETAEKTENTAETEPAENTENTAETETAEKTEGTAETETAEKTKDAVEAIAAGPAEISAEALSTQAGGGQTAENRGSMKKGHTMRITVHSQEKHMLYIGDKTKPAIALTFDDGPSWEPTTRILDVLETYDARATFFTMGYKAKKFAKQLVRQRRLRCEVANHSYNHPKLTTISAAKVKKQINRTSNLVKDATGEAAYLVRPPYGAYNDTVLEQIDAPAILWSVDTRDWKTRDADKTVANVLENVSDGDIILMHDVYEPTAEAVERLVPELIDRGYQLVTVPELALLKGKKLKKGEIYNRITAD